MKTAGKGQEESMCDAETASANGTPKTFLLSCVLPSWEPKEIRLK
jgi:hypothetical protein